MTAAGIWSGTRFAKPLHQIPADLGSHQQYLRVKILSGWETGAYPPYDTRNWVGLDGIQLYDAEAQPLIDSRPLLHSPIQNYEWKPIAASADNSFSSQFSPSNTIDSNPENEWLNAIDDELPTSIWYTLPEAVYVSKVGLWQTKYLDGLQWSYRIKDYDISLSLDGVTWKNVATNTGRNIPHDYQETSFTPALAKFVRITARSSWEAGTYPPYATRNWIGLDAFQVFGVSQPPSMIPASQVRASADNQFASGTAYQPSNVVDGDPENEWLNAIDDVLPTSIQFDLLATQTLSKIGLWQTKYLDGRQWSYRIKDYDVYTSLNGSTWTKVAANRGRDIPHDYQETMFEPASARFVRITAKSSWEAGSYPPYVASNWIGLSGFQAFDRHGFPIIDLGIAGNSFALSPEMGIYPLGPDVVGTSNSPHIGEFPLVVKKLDNSLVRHVPVADTSSPLVWPLPRKYLDPNPTYRHQFSWFESTFTSSAASLLEVTSSLNSHEYRPKISAQGHGKGKFIYEADFSPLAGYSGYAVDNMEYGFVRNAIGEAFAANSTPLIRLGAWPYPFKAAFKTRHDHFARVEVAEMENACGVRGEWYLKTEFVKDPRFPKRLADARAVAEDYGGIVGTHTTQEFVLDVGTYSENLGTLLASFADLTSLGIGHEGKWFVAPGMYATRDSSIQAIEDSGIAVTGDLSHGPYPNFALKKDAEEYGAHFSVLEVPVSRFPTRSGEHMLQDFESMFADMGSFSSDTNGLALEKTYIARTVDLTYELGGVINVYDHIGEFGNSNPELYRHGANVEPFKYYLDYTLGAGRCAGSAFAGKPNLWVTNAPEIADWWRSRSQITSTPECAISATGMECKVAILPPAQLDFRGNSSLALDIDTPPTMRFSGAWLGAGRLTELRFSDNLAKVEVPALSGGTVITVQFTSAN